MSADRRDVERGLERKGFVRVEGDHHFFIYRTLQGKKSTIRTKTSHGMRQIDDSILSQMARQCRLSRTQFDKLIECPLAQEEYETLVEQKEPGALGI